MINDIVFYSNEFYMELPTYSSGSVSSIVGPYSEEEIEDIFFIRLALPERISIG